MSIKNIVEMRIAEIDEEIEGLTETKEEYQDKIEELKDWIADQEKHKEDLQKQLTEWIEYLGSKS